jgi:hypothetical protein
MAATRVQKNELRDKVSKLVEDKFGGDYHKAFEHYDDDVKDGKISRRELAKLLLIVLVLLLLGVLPTWGHSRKRGYGPSGGLGLLLVIVLVLVFMGRI